MDHLTMKQKLTSKKKVAVVGGGLVGSLNACFFAKRGFEVAVFESREDIRSAKSVKGRSINLALSHRGRQALKHVGIEEKNLASRLRLDVAKTGCSPTPDCFPGCLQRYSNACSHDPQSEWETFSYTIREEGPAAEAYTNTELNFNHKLLDWHPENGTMIFLGPDGTEKEVQADLIVGCDGAFSATRKQFLRRSRFDFSQTYIPHGYLELTMPPKNGDFAMEPNFLHIWPRNTFMMIALPNLNKTFTCTVFMPFEQFDKITKSDEVMNFFQKFFPDSIPLIGADALKRDFFQLPAQAMVSVKCSPYHLMDKCVLMGDAAHAVVPFYGQGMNAGFEDCLVFDEIMDQLNEDFTAVLPEYTRVRVPDDHAIADLAMYNYVEMRAHVNSKYFLFCKYLDNTLHLLMPKTFIPLYTMVTFTRTRYHEAVIRWRRQNKVITRALWFFGTASTVGSTYLLVRYFPKNLNTTVKQLWRRGLALKWFQK